MNERNQRAKKYGELYLDQDQKLEGSISLVLDIDLRQVMSVKLCSPAILVLICPSDT